jgi:hypothetical protein
LSSFGKFWSDVAVGNDRATEAEIQGGAMPAQFFEEAGADFDFVAASAERHIDGTHAESMKLKL